MRFNESVVVIISVVLCMLCVCCGVLGGVGVGVGSVFVFVWYLCCVWVIKSLVMVFFGFCCCGLLMCVFLKDRNFNLNVDIG